MTTKYYPPSFNANQYNCPHCGVYARQEWYSVKFGNLLTFPELDGVICAHCNEKSIWLNEKLVIPDVLTSPPLHEDAPPSIIDDYNEAASILNKSPRGAAALLRLALQKLLKELGEEGKNINEDIKSLVQKGLPIQIQQALDIVRVIGNESVHPGVIDLNDDRDIANQLFGLINIIIENRIAGPKRVQELFDKLPESKKEAITSRDS